LQCSYPFWLVVHSVKVELGTSGQLDLLVVRWSWPRVVIERSIRQPRHAGVACSRPPGEENIIVNKTVTGYRRRRHAECCVRDDGFPSKPKDQGVYHVRNAVRSGHSFLISHLGPSLLLLTIDFLFACTRQASTCDSHYGCQYPGKHDRTYECVI
jgi:hypothetical protein